MRRVVVSAAIVSGVVALGLGVLARDKADAASECPVSNQTLGTQLAAADAADTSGLDNHYWAVVVDRSGTVCAVAFSGPDVDSQWLLSRQIAAAKAFTANGWSRFHRCRLRNCIPAQPGAPANPLFDLEAGNPVSPEDFTGPFNRFGTANDPPIETRGRDDHVRRRTRPLRRYPRHRRTRVVGRHGVRRSLDGVAAAQSARHEADGGRRSDNARQRNRSSSLPERRRNPGKALGSCPAPARDASRGPARDVLLRRM